VPAPEIYAFGAFTLDATGRSLSRGGAAIHLAPKAHDLLVALVRHAGRLLTKQELLAQVWPDAFVEEGILSVHVSSLRKALGGRGRGAAYIQTVARSGYRFVAPVTSPPAGGRAAARAPRRPLEAIELVGRGRSHLLSASYFEVAKAVEAFQAAIALDPSYAAAHAGLALAKCAQASLRAAPHVAAYADAKAAALRALAMDDACADAQVALGAVLFLSEWDWIGAERSLQRALQISPNSTEAWLHYGSLMEALGKLEEGLQLKQQALERDPFSALVRVQIAAAYWHQRRYDEAIVWANKALEIDPKHLLAREFLAGAYLMTANFDAFQRENVMQAEAFGCPPAVIAQIRAMCGGLQAAYARGGHAAVARCALDEAAKQAQHSGSADIRFAVLHAQAGDLDEAFRRLDRALDSRDPSLVHLAVAPQWDALRGDKRLRQRLEAMGLAASLNAAGCFEASP
jgi:DNA-binding winged helix-turn-helix (wHTH) protein/Tfp pilus assembly protein PilF